MEIEKDILCKLSDKQREALELLILHKTSKEMSRILGISPNTVDQRLNSAKRTLGASSRGELALSYRRLVTICEKTTYDESRIAISAMPLDQGDRHGAENFLIQRGLEPDEKSKSGPTNRNDQILPELFEGRWGILARLGVIASIAFVLIASLLGGIVIIQVLSGLMTHPF